MRNSPVLLGRYFGNINDSAPGTVGTVLGGCLLSMRKGWDSCSPSCYNSVPLHNQKVCDENMIMGVPVDDRLHFNINRKNNSPIARLYLPNGIDLSEHEKDYLSQVGFEQIEICDYGNNICTPLRDMKSLPTRKISKVEIPTKTNDYVMLSVILLILLIFLMIVLFAIFKPR